MQIQKEFGRNPQVDWATLLLVTFIVIGALAFTSYTLYNAVVNGNIQGSNGKSEQTFTKVNEKVIDKVTTRFEEKEAVSAKARAGYTGPADPSI